VCRMHCSLCYRVKHSSALSGANSSMVCVWSISACWMPNSALAGTATEAKDAEQHLLRLLPAHQLLHVTGGF
jgi:hypothetical protein